MMLLLQTKSSRLLLILLGLCLAVSLSYWYKASKYIHPIDYYYFTTNGEGIDIRRLTGKIIVDSDLQPYYGSRTWDQEENAYRIYKERCDFGVLANKGINPVGKETRNVMLCNAAGKNNSDFAIAVSYFDERVNEGYGQYYWRIITDMLYSVTLAFGAWLLILCAWAAYRWVKAGQPNN